MMEWRSLCVVELRLRRISIRRSKARIEGIEHAFIVHRIDLGPGIVTNHRRCRYIRSRHDSGNVFRLIKKFDYTISESFELLKPLSGTGTHV
jgi:hypothetical protein